MKRFIFKLAALYRLKERAEELAKEVYGKALKNQNTATQMRDEVIQEMADVSQRRMTQIKNTFSGVYLAQIAMYYRQLEQKLAERETFLEEARSQAKSALNQLLCARKEVEVLEKLREKQKEAHEFHVRREEQKLLDELAIREIPEHQSINLSDQF